MIEASGMLMIEATVGVWPEKTAGSISRAVQNKVLLIFYC